MCRMLGVVFRNGFPIESLHDLRQVAEVGQIPGEEERGHRDGWGMVSFANGSPWYMGRSPRAAFMDPSFDSAMSDVPKVKPPNILIAHVRAASSGGATLQNTHPFVVDDVVLGHNGTIMAFNPVTKRKPKGETDTEKLALLVAERTEETGVLKSALISVIQEELPRHEFTAAILLVSDGKILYGYRDYANPDRADYYDLRIAKCRDYVALFQESSAGYCARISRVKKGELVSVDLDLLVKREILV